MSPPALASDCKHLLRKQQAEFDLTFGRSVLLFYKSKLFGPSIRPDALHVVGDSA